MKKSFIQTALNTYDSEKGYGRMIKDEPHISKIRLFIERIEGEKLKKSELHELASILLLKGNRNTDDSAAARCFKTLAAQFGGFALLDLLNGDPAMLTEHNVQYCAYLSDNLNSAQRKIFLKSLLHLSSYRNLPQVLRDLSVIAGDKLGLEGCLSLVMRLSRFPTLWESQTDVLLKQLKAVQPQQMFLMDKLVWKLAEIDEYLVTSGNIKRIFSLKQIECFGRVFDLLPREKLQYNLEWLFRCEASLDKGAFRVDEIVKLFNYFKKQQWEINEYIFDILSPETDSAVFLQAFDVLQSIKIPSPLLPQILSAVFQRHYHSVQKAKAVRALSEGVIQKQDLSLSFKFPEHAEQVAIAIRVLRSEELFMTETEALICTVPQHSDLLAYYLVDLKRNDCSVEGIIAAMFVNPTTAAASVFLLKEIGEVPDITKQINNFFFGQQLTLKQTESFLSIMKAIAAAGLKDLTYFEDILTQTSYIETLEQAIRKTPVLNKDKLHSLMYLGESDFSQITKAAHILSQGQRGLAFFSPVTAQVDRQVQKTCGKNVRTLQIESLQKIAGYCSDNNLPKEVVEQLVESAFPR